MQVKSLHTTYFSMPLGSSFMALVMWITDMKIARKKKKTVLLRRWKEEDSSQVLFLKIKLEHVYVCSILFLWESLMGLRDWLEFWDVS